jgi:hypothetical protein
MSIVPDRKNLAGLGDVRFEKQPQCLTISKRRMVFGTTKQARYISTSIVDLGRNVCAVVRPPTLQHGITFLAALGCEDPVWNNEDNDSHALLVSVKSFLEDVAGLTIYSS